MAPTAKQTRLAIPKSTWLFVTIMKSTSVTSRINAATQRDAIIACITGGMIFKTGLPNHWRIGNRKKRTANTLGRIRPDRSLDVPDSIPLVYHSNTLEVYNLVLINETVCVNTRDYCPEIGRF